MDKLWMGFLVIIILPGVALAQWVYWTDTQSGSIQRASVEGYAPETVRAGLISPAPIVLDISAAKMYWAERLPNVTSRFRRADLNGGNLEELFSTTHYVLGMGVDFAAGKIYWSYSFDFASGVRRADLDGGNRQDLLEGGLDWPAAIAIDVPGGKLYLTRPGSARIQRTNLDGSALEDLVTSGLQYPSAVALDPIGGKIYWTDQNANKIQRANLDGSNAEDVVTIGLSGPRGINVDKDNGKLYWLNPGTDKIQRSNFDGSSVEDVVVSGVHAPWGLAVDPRTVPPDIPTLSGWGVLTTALLLFVAGYRILARRRSPVPHLSACILASWVVGTATRGYAQVASIPSEHQVVALDSGTVPAAGTGTQPQVVFSHTLTIDDAAWIRLHFGVVQLSGAPAMGDASYVRMTSLTDGAVQTLDAAGFEKWENSSGYFNGGEVLIELVAYPGTGTNRMQVDSVALGLSTPAGEGGVVLGCSPDERGLSYDPRAGRIRYWSRVEGAELWCSAWLFGNRANWLFSAGHCCSRICWPGDVSVECQGSGGFVPVVEFNVPLSDPDGTINQSALSDQYPMDQASIQCESIPNTGSGCPVSQVGADWCFFGARGNGVYVTPLRAQGSTYRLVTVVPPPPAVAYLRVTGYGWDDSPPGSTGGFNERSGAQQTDTGSYYSQSSQEISFKVYVEPGNSGSPVERECHKVAYAILSSSGCIGGESSGSGNRVDYPPIQMAIANPLGACRDCNGNGIDDACDVSCAPSGCVPPCNTSLDCNSNQVPDGCEPNHDCNVNGTRDICDIGLGTSADCNKNSIPDECDVATGWSTDCQCNLILDECELLAGSSLDSDGNCLPNQCEGQKPCCLPDGICIDTNFADCHAQGGCLRVEYANCASIPWVHRCRPWLGPMGP